MDAMNQQKSKQSGFAHLFILALIVIIAIGGVGYYVKIKSSKLTKPSAALASNSATGWDKGCTGNYKVAMTHMPMNIADVSNVAPMGLTAGAHVTPIDHLYFYQNPGPRDKYPVFAMADGTIIEIQVRNVSVDSGSSRPAEYRIVIQHSCQTISYFDLVTKLDSSILAKAPDAATKGFEGRIDVKSGQIIGWIGNQSLDTGIYNLGMTLKGFIHPALYSAEPWKVHTDDFFSYFSESLKSQMLAKNPRTDEPRSGKIDYDQPGKLIGNWFKQGTNGYAGSGTNVGKGDGTGYWSTHLAIFYAAYNAKEIIVSIGSFVNNQPNAFSVAGNTPDPATITADSGIVKYELYKAEQGGSKTINTNSNQPADGVILLQVLPGEKLKVEKFPGKTGAQVVGFTSAAEIYER